VCSKTPTKESTAEFEYTFSGWSPEISTANSNQIYTPIFTETKRKYYFQTFIPTQQRNWGSVQAPPNGYYDYGTLMSITAFPNVGYELDDWLVIYSDRVEDWYYEVDGSINPLEIRLTEGVDVFVSFKKQIFLITTSNSPTDAGTVTGGGNCEYGSTITLTAKPKPGYKFVRWNDGDTSPTRTVVVTADATYIAIFELDKINELYIGTYEITSVHTDGKTVVFVVDEPITSSATAVFDTVDGYHIKLSNTVPSGMVEATECYLGDTKVYG
jgi:hypothetical protein